MNNILNKTLNFVTTSSFTKRYTLGLQKYANKTKTQENVLINEGESSVTQPSTSSEIDQPLVLSASRAKLKRRTISSSSSDNSDGGIG